MPSAEEQALIRLFWERYDAVREPVTEALREQAAHIPAFAQIMKQIDPQTQAEMDRQSRERERAAVMEQRWADYLDNLLKEGANYAQMGVPFADWHRLIKAYRSALLPRLLESHSGETWDFARQVQGMDAFVDLAMHHIAEGYLDAKQEHIRAQQEAIRELSTPVLALRERLLIVPLVGMIDTWRAKQLTETLLSAIREHRALAVVMDITGVPVVDSQVANHFVQSVEAARLMGADVVLTGISPDIARTLVAIGADLRSIRTMGDLQAGVHAAEARLASFLDPVRRSTDAEGGG